MLPLLLLLFSLLSFHPPAAVSARCTTVTTAKTFQKCMTLPSQQASIAWTFHPHNATLEIVFFGTFISPSGWVGWGINPSSAKMTGTRALIAFPDPNSGRLVLLPYILDPTVKLQKNSLVSSPLDIDLLTSSATLYGGRLATIHDGAAIQIHATLKLVPNKTKIHHVWNRGLYVQGYVLNYFLKHQLLYCNEKLWMSKNQKANIFFLFFLLMWTFFFLNFIKLKVIWVLLLDLKLDTACKAMTQI